MENEIEILKSQIQALKDLIQIKDQTIEALRSLPASQSQLPGWIYNLPQTFTPPYTVTCTSEMPELGFAQNNSFSTTKILVGV